MRAKINPVQVFPKVATEICITAVEQTDSGSKVSWCLFDNEGQPLTAGDADVGAEAHQKYGTVNDKVVVDLTLLKLGLTRAK